MKRNLYFAAYVTIGMAAIFGLLILLWKAIGPA